MYHIMADTIAELLELADRIGRDRRHCQLWSLALFYVNGRLPQSRGFTETGRAGGQESRPQGAVGYHETLASDSGMTPTNRPPSQLPCARRPRGAVGLPTNTAIGVYRGKSDRSEQTRGPPTALFLVLVITLQGIERSGERLLHDLGRRDPSVERRGDVSDPHAVGAEICLGFSYLGQSTFEDGLHRMRRNRDLEDPTPTIDVQEDRAIDPGDRCLTLCKRDERAPDRKMVSGRVIRRLGTTEAESRAGKAVRPLRAVGLNDLELQKLLEDKVGDFGAALAAGNEHHRQEARNRSARTPRFRRQLSGPGHREDRGARS